MNTLIDIIIPHAGNKSLLGDCLYTLMKTNTGIGKYIRVNIIDNSLSILGSEGPLDKFFQQFTIIKPSRSLLCGASCQLGYEKTDAPYIVVLGDDTSYPECADGFLLRFLDLMELRTEKPIGMVGPIMPAGSISQSPTCINNPINKEGFCKTKNLFTSCCMFKREAIENANTWPKIDYECEYIGDFAVCVELQEAGYDLLLDQKTFVFHLGGGSYRNKLGEYYHSDKQAKDTQEAMIKRFGKDILKKYDMYTEVS